VRLFQLRDRIRYFRDLVVIESSLVGCSVARSNLHYFRDLVVIEVKRSEIVQLRDRIRYFRDLGRNR
jgi:hypothetical protein